MTEREELLNELWGEFGSEMSIEAVADFILARDKKRDERILEPIQERIAYAEDCPYCNKMAGALKKTLTKAKEEGKA